jgi:hypothetical protein
MYHDMLDEPFEEEVHIYTYSRELFRETLQDARARDLWIGTHERIYKYIRERNALRIHIQEGEEVDPEDGRFHFTADDGLNDSIFNVTLTLKITLPQGWTGDTVTVGPEDGYSYLEVRNEEAGRFVLYDWLPVPDVRVQVHEGIYDATGLDDPRFSGARVQLSAFPNPFQREARIRVSGTSHMDSYLIVRDIHGRIVQEIRELHGDSFLVSREYLPPGIYVVQLVRNGNPLAALKLLAL